ncbi:MAG: histidine phosphatase family protein [Planctomycetales bacterium]|nr:histidine phosphatase family protein [Planctomycetales bacterium]
MPEADETLLYLVRHGATPANEQRPYVLQGHGIDTSLSDTGQRQAEAVAGFLADRPLDVVLSSPMKRARETAAAIAAPHGITPGVLEAISECDVGRWEGRDWGAIMEDDTEAYHLFMNDPATHGYPEGESYADVLDRVGGPLDGVLAGHRGQTVAVVAHNIVNRVYVARLMGWPLSRAREIRQDNTGINVIRGRDDEITLMSFNVRFHLDDAGL